MLNTPSFSSYSDTSGHVATLMRAISERMTSACISPCWPAASMRQLLSRAFRHAIMPPVFFTVGRVDPCRSIYRYRANHPLSSVPLSVRKIPAAYPLFFPPPFGQMSRFRGAYQQHSTDKYAHLAVKALTLDKLKRYQIRIQYEAHTLAATPHDVFSGTWSPIRGLPGGMRAPP